MSYEYKVEKRDLLTDAGSRKFIKNRDYLLALLEKAGAVRIQEAWNGMDFVTSWEGLAMFDRMVELKDIREITDSNVAGQYRVFVKA